MVNRLVALELLRSHPEGLTTAELVRLSKGELGWERVFVAMERLADLGYAVEARVPASVDYPIAQTRYTLTAEGDRVLH